jgi:hypothetical protein
MIRIFSNTFSCSNPCNFLANNYKYDLHYVPIFVCFAPQGFPSLMGSQDIIVPPEIIAGLIIPEEAPIRYVLSLSVTSRVVTVVVALVGAGFSGTPTVNPIDSSPLGLNAKDLRRAAASRFGE